MRRGVYYASSLYRNLGTYMPSNTCGVPTTRPRPAGKHPIPPGACNPRREGLPDEQIGRSVSTVRVRGWVVGGFYAVQRSACSAVCAVQMGMDRSAGRSAGGFRGGIIFFYVWEDEGMGGAWMCSTWAVLRTFGRWVEIYIILYYMGGSGLMVIVIIIP
ncbi:hypothetical protein BO71DRAFT_444779 [Aspergillus ellipticus CBS 707.79]|uniref:Uncharacterized protein n=1 Tax=Aspergillus ellipticus CBS 707.79 TaxID=1448320 RepID=A0A319CX43_9EURO|nr:hypothetical protein BO71DRAFT_444779 [Aspergillus ellipticus CBS 707.79]